MQKPTPPGEVGRSAERDWAAKLAEEAAVWRSKKRPGRTRRIASHGRDIRAETIFRPAFLKLERI